MKATDRRLCFLKERRGKQMLVSYHKRDAMAMKDYPDCEKTCILTINGMFGCLKCRHYFR